MTACDTASICHASGMSCPTAKQWRQCAAVCGIWRRESLTQRRAPSLSCRLFSVTKSCRTAGDVCKHRACCCHGCCFCCCSCCQHRVARLPTCCRHTCGLLFADAVLGSVPGPLRCPASCAIELADCRACNWHVCRNAPCAAAVVEAGGGAPQPRLEVLARRLLNSRCACEDRMRRPSQLRGRTDAGSSAEERYGCR